MTTQQKIKTVFTGNTVKRNAFENALECLYYGNGKSDWNDCGLKTESDRNEVWDKAKYFMSRDDWEW